MPISTFLDHIWQSTRSIYRAGRGRQMHRGSTTHWQSFPEEVKTKAPCVFVLSTGRCGTRLLTAILRRTGNCDVNHHAELASELQYPSRIAYESGDFSDEAMELIALCSRFEAIQTSYLHDRVFVETNNRITFLAPYLAKAFKNSKFIHLVRSPIGFVRSGVNSDFYLGGYYDTGRIFPQDAERRKEFYSYSQLKKVGWLWNETNRVIENFKSTLDSNRILTVKSEEMFKGTNVLENMVRFSGGKEIASDVLRRIASKRINSGQSTGLPSNFSKWRSEDQLELIETCPLASLYSYELPWEKASQDKKLADHGRQVQSDAA